jgi:hypothetical protein
MEWIRDRFTDDLEAADVIATDDRLEPVTAQD